MISSSTCGAKRASTCSTIGLPCKSCRPLSTPPKIAGHGRGDGPRDGGEPGVQAGERSGEAADFVAHHAMPEGAIALEVLVGIDDQLVNLRRETREHVLDHRLAVQELQALVDAA